jgi:ATP-dependent protease ClpP protease subunit
MAKEVLLYGEMYSYSARDFIRSVEEAKGSDLSVRVNSMGGDVDYGYGMIAKFKEFEGKKSVKVDGSAASMAAFFTLYADDVEALDVSTFTFHRAAYPEWIERDAKQMDGYREQVLTKANADLRAALESKVDAAEWERVTGVTIDEMFSRDSRIDVLLTAKQAKQLGIVSKINALTPQKSAEIEARLLALGESVTGLRLAAKNEPKPNKPNPKAMTIETLKAEHPEVYAAAVNAGVTQERDRVGAWAVFADVDVKAVTEGIKSGASITATATAEFSRKAFAAGQVAALEENSPKPTATTEPVAPADPNANPELAALEASVNNLLNLK